MKNGKQSAPDLKKENNKKTVANAKDKTASIDRTIESAVNKTKPKSGRGLANEGTITSYDEAR